MKVAVVGASGYIGGELVRLLLGHPSVQLVQVTSDRHAGEPVHLVHPNLRGLTQLHFNRHDAAAPADAIFVALPHGEAMKAMPTICGLGGLVVDLSADFRFADPAVYERWYGTPVTCPDLLPSFTPGLPELYRDRLRTATRISVPGCAATAAILAVAPLVDSIMPEVLVEALVGSSGAGPKHTDGSHHPERSGTMRVYSPLAHRHHAEIDQACGVRSAMSAIAVEAVRGVQVRVNATVSRPLSDAEIWGRYRERYGAEDFVRIVQTRRGIHRFPDPKILWGSNFCDISFAQSTDGRRLLLIAALDNLMKGGAGNALQSFNLAAGFDETTGLQFAGLHPA